MCVCWEEGGHQKQKRPESMNHFELNCTTAAAAATAIVMVMPIRWFGVNWATKSEKGKLIKCEP